MYVLILHTTTTVLLLLLLLLLLLIVMLLILTVLIHTPELSDLFPTENQRLGNHINFQLSSSKQLQLQ